jgi:hypothetical protein
MAFALQKSVVQKKPPMNVHAVAYRTAFEEWGKFDSSNVLLNGAYELTRNALNSNMLGTQTDCPHREKLQYGGDLVADSPAAMHFFDLSGFYTKSFMIGPIHSGRMALTQRHRPGKTSMNMQL